MTLPGNDSSPLVRPARLEDAASISRIHNQAITSNLATMREVPSTPEEVHDLIESSGSRSAILVVEADGVLCGWARFWPYSLREGYRFAAETAIFIDAAFQGRGLGTALLAALVEESRRRSYHHLVAKIMAQNTASIKVHMKLGYEIVGTQREIGFKRGDWTNVAILQRVCRETN